MSSSEWAEWSFFVDTWEPLMPLSLLRSLMWPRPRRRSLTSNPPPGYFPSFSSPHSVTLFYPHFFLVFFLDCFILLFASFIFFFFLSIISFYFSLLLFGILNTSLLCFQLHLHLIWTLIMPRRPVGRWHWISALREVYLIILFPLLEGYFFLSFRFFFVLLSFLLFFLLSLVPCFSFRNS